MVFSSGASTTFTKSYWPSTAHWAFTVAPSCSTSWLTSRMRAGLFFSVCTPSGVSVVSITYIGKAATSVSRGCRETSRILGRAIASLTGNLAWVTSKLMKRALATILAVGVAVVAPAAAGAQVQLTFKTWKVTTQNGKQHSVARKGTFVRCGRKVVKITATYDYSGATKGSSFT